MAIDHVVKQGDCILSLSRQHGLLWETVWNHPKNTDLKNLRKNPNILFPGDVVHIPDIEIKEESCGTDTTHEFKKLIDRAQLKLKLLKEPAPSNEKIEDLSSDWSEYIEPEVTADEPEPEANVEYALYIDGALFAKGKTDSDGCLTETIPPDARSGKLVLRLGKPDERSIELNLGYIDPIDTLQGACQRLNNLGYNCPIDKSDYTDDIHFAIQMFQKNHGMDVTGAMDDATTAKLKEVFGF